MCLMSCIAGHVCQLELIVTASEEHTCYRMSDHSDICRSLPLAEDATWQLMVPQQMVRLNQT